MWCIRKYFICKVKCGGSKNKVVLEDLISMTYESFILELWCLHCTLTLVLILWRQKRKYGLLSNHLFQRKQEHGGWKEPQSNDKTL